MFVTTLGKVLADPAGALVVLPLVRTFEVFVTTLGEVLADPAGALVVLPLVKLVVSVREVLFRQNQLRHCEPATSTLKRYSRPK